MSELLCEAEVLGARSSPAMADGGFGCSWGGGYRARAREREMRGNNGKIGRAHV